MEWANVKLILLYFWPKGLKIFQNFQLIWSCTSTHEPNTSKEVGLERIFSQFLAPRLLLTGKRMCSWQGRCELTEQTAQTIPVQSEAREGQRERSTEGHQTQARSYIQALVIRQQRWSLCCRKHSEHPPQVQCVVWLLWWWQHSQRTRSLKWQSFWKVHSPRSIYKELIGGRGISISVY